MKITVLEESIDFATLDIEKLFSKLKSHEMSRKGHSNHDASLSSKPLITSAHVGGYDANPTNTTISSALEFALSSLAATSDERRRSPRCCFECGNTTHFIADYPKSKKLDSSNKYNYYNNNNQNDSSNKGDDKKKYRFGTRKRRSFRRSCPERVLF
jgi:hypothetical protein